MSKADEMLKELGYEKDIGEAYGVIRYKHIKEDYYIRFYLEDRSFDSNRISNNEIYPLEIDKKIIKCNMQESLGIRMVVDINEINLENLYMYQPNYRKRQKKTGLTKKEYQHKYYMELTKIKRKKLQE